MDVLKKKRGRKGRAVRQETIWRAGWMDGEG